MLAAAAGAARHLDAPLVLTHGLPVSFAERSVGLRAALEHARCLLDAAAQRLVDEAPDVPFTTRLVRAHPHELVGEGADTGLLVLGGPRRHAEDELGLVARSALHHASCPVLLVPR
jgi:nucleotide-binding universal stress UspA family protein